MNIFIWEYASHITGSEHDGGGVVVRAASLERAREMIAAQLPRGGHSWRGDLPCTALKEDPEHVWATDDGDETLLIFPDEGCCGS